ncbi:hypothetical protein TL16_g00185 [Triparma laevis f. inornata]|uniref:Uncharacterized protein n=1 Tax=Triparma laevis f. inornata TaxID=1714386 RepID=A0A9W7DMU6_9STRA|nr:hypothetical protein TL16_g00185 [Triparma laevis f. inornata]
MSKNSDFLEACAAFFQTIPGNVICTNCLLTPSAALHIVDKYLASDMTLLPLLLEQYETSAKVVSSEFFSASATSANSLSNRINLSNASKTTAKAAVMWKKAAPKREAGDDIGSSGMEEEEEEEERDAKAKIEEAAQLMEKQQKQYQVEQEKRDAELRRLKMELLKEKDENQRTEVARGCFRKLRTSSARKGQRRWG